MLARRIPRGGSGGFTTIQYAGTLTVGTISTITDDTKYNTWPIIDRIATGDLLLAYTKGDSHNLDNTGKAVGKLSSNEGGSWGSEFTIYDHASLWTTPMGVTTLASGRILVPLWRGDNAVSGSGESGLVYSDDDGATWSSWVAMPNSFTRESFVAGRCIELPGGDILVTIEGSNTAQSAINRSCHTLRSSDQGATWGSEVTVRNYTDDSRPYYESKLLRLANNDLLCIHRCAALAGTAHYISKSTDNGLTWGAPYSAFAGYAAPSTIRHFSNVLISVTRRDSDAAAIAYTSIDNGVTWGSAVALDATMFEMEYGSPVELFDGRVLVVYGSQPTSSLTNADIKQVYLTVS